MFVLHHISSLVHSCKLLCPAEKLPADGALGRKTENVGKTTSRLRNVILQRKNGNVAGQPRAAERTCGLADGKEW